MFIVFFEILVQIAADYNVLDQINSSKLLIRISSFILLYDFVSNLVKEIGCLFSLVGEYVLIDKSIAVHIVLGCDTTRTLKHQVYAIVFATSNNFFNI
jgi:hypothetical protein